MLVRFISLLSAISLIYACATPGQLPVSGSDSDTKKAVQPAGYDPEYRATYDQPVDLIHTRLDIKPDWNDRYLYGTWR